MMYSKYLKKQKSIEVLSEPISILPLPLKLINTLEEAGIKTIEDLLMCCPHSPRKCKCGGKHILGIKNVGRISLEEIYSALEGLGFVRLSRQTLAPSSRIIK